MYSFDVFDTLITRITYNPKGIFDIMQEKIKNWDAPQYIKNNFAQIREKAEINARLWSSYEEVTIEEIYVALEDMTAIDVELKNKLIELELQIECLCVFPIKKNIDKLVELYENGEVVVLISDMYLPKNVIREMLVKVNPIFHKLPLYVSSEYRKTKSSGSLYLEVKKRYSNESEWVHYGDNQYSDIDIAELLGIRAVKVDVIVNNSHIEQYILGNKSEKTVLAQQLMVGIIKCLKTANDISDKEMIGITAGWGVLFPYVEWILRIAEKKGVKNLYFIARDGYILKKIADIYINLCGLNINTKCIYGSRKAWRVDSEEARETVLGYFENVLDTTEESFNFIDLQGTGISMQYVADIVGKKYSNKINVFYYNKLKNGSDSYASYIYTSNPRASVIEVFCRAPHGATLYYERDDGEVRPVLEPSDDAVWEQHGLFEYEKGVLLMTQIVCKRLNELKLWQIFRSVSDGILHYCMDSPDESILDYIGDMPHNSDNISETSVKFAPKLSNQDIFNIFMRQTSQADKEYYQGENLEYSIKRLNPAQQNKVKYYNANYGKLLGRVLRGIINIGKKSKVPKKRVLIYGAGIYGRRMYKYASDVEKGLLVVGWIDRRWKQLREEGYDVISLLEATRLEYDYIIIAIKGDIQTSKSVRQVYNTLINIGVSSDKILLYDQLISD